MGANGEAQKRELMVLHIREEEFTLWTDWVFCSYVAYEPHVAASKIVVQPFLLLLLVFPLFHPAGHMAQKCSSLPELLFPPET